MNQIVIDYLKDIFSKYADRKELEETADKKQNNINAVNNLNNEIVKYNKRIESINTALKDIYIDKSSNIISEDEFIEIKTGLEKDKKKYTDKIIELDKYIKNIKIGKDKSSMVDKLIKEFLELKQPDKQILINLINRIEIMKDKQVKIFVNFNLN